jgi:nucleoid-associated protein YgaU
MLEKATVTNTVTGDRVAVMFNPEDYVVNRQNAFAQAQVPGLSANVLQFVHGESATLEMDLLVDTLEEHREGSRVVNAAQSDVRLQTGRIVGLMDIEPTTHAPPPLLFTWGSLSFSCVLARCVQRFTHFIGDGTPVRARLSCQFLEYRNAEAEAKEVKRETADYSKRHQLVEAESLDGLAAREYGDPAQWRLIARANGVTAPRADAAGRVLLLPRLPSRLPLDFQDLG